MTVIGRFQEASIKKVVSLYEGMNMPKKVQIVAQHERILKTGGRLKPAVYIRLVSPVGDELKVYHERLLTESPTIEKAIKRAEAFRGYVGAETSVGYENVEVVSNE